MNPRAIRIRNYRTFDELDLDLPDGCVAILGANGAGKSSLANVVDLALFGPDGRSWAPYLTQGAADTELMLELVFEHAGEIYRVRRGFSGRGRGKATLDLEVYADVGHAPQVWMPLTSENIGQTQEGIEKIIGLTRETFRASSMLVQGDGAAFTEAQPRDRKTILAKILGLDRFDALLELVKRDRRQAENAIQRLNGSLEVADAELSMKPEVERAMKVADTIVTEATNDLAEAEKRLQQAATAAAEQEERRRARAGATAAIAEASATLGPLEDRLHRAAEADRAIATASDELASLATPAQIAELEREAATLEGELEAYRQAVIRREEAIREAKVKLAERNAILGRANELIAKAHDARQRSNELAAQAKRGEAAKCDRCEQTLGEEALRSSIASLRVEADDLDAAAKDLDVQANAVEIPEIETSPQEPDAKPKLDVVRQRLEAARNDELQRARLEERIRALRADAIARPEPAEIAAARAAFEQAKSEAEKIPEPNVDELATAQAAALSARARMEEERIRLDSAKADLVLQSDRFERLEGLEATSAENRTERERLRIDVDRLAILERAYGRDGIPALIIGNAAIPSIEAEAGRILAELGTSYRVELRTEKALAGGGTADALDVVIVTEDGERPYETFSGGERTRINLAVRIALARLLAHRRGAESRLLVIDEPEYLDQAGTAALAAVLEGLTGDFERIYLISHVPDLRDAFDSVIEVVRDERGYSRVAA